MVKLLLLVAVLTYCMLHAIELICALRGLTYCFMFCPTVRKDVIVCVSAAALERFAYAQEAV